MPHPPEKVWRALTQSALIEEWLMKNDFEPVVGRKFTLRISPAPHWNGVTDCEVLEIEPHRTLSYSWNSSGEEAEGGAEDRRHLDADANAARRSPADGAIWLPGGPNGELPGRRSTAGESSSISSNGSQGGPTRDAYSTSGVDLALASTRWRLKSVIEANLNVPSLVSASIEPSAKIL